MRRPFVVLALCIGIAFFVAVLAFLSRAATTEQSFTKPTPTLAVGEMIRAGLTGTIEQSFAKPEATVEQTSVPKSPTNSAGLKSRYPGPNIEVFARALPTYPQARVLKLFCLEEYPYGCGDTYTSSDPPRTVAGYYKHALITQGWTLHAEQKSQGEDYELEFVRTNLSSPAPARLYLYMNFVDDLGRGTYITVLLDPWPDPNNLPQYPDIRELKTTWSKDAGDGFPIRTTTYVADADKEEILDYYNKMMLRHGWSLEFLTEAQAEFSYLRGSITVIGAAVVVLTDSIGTNQTKVTITAHGTEVAEAGSP